MKIDVKIINEAMDGRFDGIEPCVIVEELLELEAKNERLEEALLQHRQDLHQGSTRPCPTCRKSAEALGLKVPDQCARERWDKQALNERRKSDRSKRNGCD